MKKIISTFVLAIAAATSAQASVTIGVGSGQGTGSDVITFDGNDGTSTFSYTTYSYVNNADPTLSTFSAVSTGLPTSSSAGVKLVTGNSSNNYATPAGDATTYMAILGGYAEGLTTATALNSLTFLWGSVDSANTVYLFNGSTEVGAVRGQSVIDSIAGYSNTSSYLVTVSSDKAFNNIRFASTANSFELDNIKTTAAVPEPASWAMMVGGFGLLGGALRRKKAAVSFA